MLRIVNVCWPFSRPQNLCNPDIFWQFRLIECKTSLICSQTDNLKNFQVLVSSSLSKSKLSRLLSRWILVSKFLNRCYKTQVVTTMIENIVFKVIRAYLSIWLIFKQFDPLLYNNWTCVGTVSRHISNWRLVLASVH